jgi:hypothetical protein
MKNLQNVDEETRKVLDKHEEFGDITIIGNFDDPEWTVEPPK